MADTFPAYLVSRTDAGQAVECKQLSENDLMPGDVTIKVEYSGLNYKDGLALTGKAPIIRRFPMIPGIDLSGTVVRSEHPGFKAGDVVVLTGFGVGETHYGGYAGMARVNGDWLLHLPEGLTSRQAMIIGTAGYTAMQCVMALEGHGIEPESGDILVTGATGGVGSFAVLLLAKRGYRVIAATGRPEEKDYLAGLGAAEIFDRHELTGMARPLGREHWIGAIDVAGGNTLANVLSHISYGGAVTACGLADSMNLPASVAPFILRGITLYGISSVMSPMKKRGTAWARLTQDLDPKELEKMSSEIGFDELPKTALEILAGRNRGRTVVKIPN
jgi:acrylyl-CoA reductase (NADPH)